MKKHGIPTIPGSDTVLKTQEDALEVARKVGYPVADQGGGRRRGQGHADCAQ